MRELATLVAAERQFLSELGGASDAHLKETGKEDRMDDSL
jgi:hypothetical protein